MPWEREARVTQVSVCRKTQERRWTLACICVHDIWTKLLRCGVDGTLAGIDESEFQDQQQTPKKCNLTPEKACDRLLLGLAVRPQTMTAQRHAVVHVERRRDSELVREARSKKVGCRRRTLLSPLELRIAPMSMVATKVTTISTRLWDGELLGAPVSLSWAVVVGSSGIVGDPRLRVPKSKLPEIEAVTVLGRIRRN